eukprot:7028-Heterococcus_DN1.PRE.1
MLVVTSHHAQHRGPITPRHSRAVVITQDRPLLPLVSYIHHARQLQHYVLTPPVCYICNMVYTPGVLTVRSESNEVNERTCTSAHVLDATAVQDYNKLINMAS